MAINSDRAISENLTGAWLPCQESSVPPDKLLTKDEAWPIAANVTSRGARQTTAGHALTTSTVYCTNVNSASIDVRFWG